MPSIAILETEPTLIQLRSLNNNFVGNFFIAICCCLLPQTVAVYFDIFCLPTRYLRHPVLTFTATLIKPGNVLLLD